MRKAGQGIGCVNLRVKTAGRLTVLNKRQHGLGQRIGMVTNQNAFPLGQQAARANDIGRDNGSPKYQSFKYN